ncbi:hypothetical protein [Paraburkholderia sp. SIMBA_054]|uniref:hypothetical protein n=1 Tax=Paraburkholderia sp. SIMBA_054 TaxID=3085795 RepID=UPI00397BA335
MKVWFTRPSTWDLTVRGIERCEMWIHKPVYDPSPRGKERDPLFPDFPIGWRVLDVAHGDVTSQTRITVREALGARMNEDIAMALWDALCRSVDGKGATEGDPAPHRWADRAIHDDDEHRQMSTFLFEYDVPPDLWFRAAWLNGWEQQTAAARWAQTFFPLDTEMGADEGPDEPVENALITYSGTTVALAPR